MDARMKSALTAWETKNYKDLDYPEQSLIEAYLQSQPMLLIPSEVKLSQYSSDSVNIVIRIVHASPEDGKPRNYGSDLANGLFVDELVLEIRMHKYTYNPIPEIHTYFNIGYSLPYFVELDRAEKQVKTLRTIRARMDKFNSEWGFTEDPGQTAVRFAKAIGSKEFCKQTRDCGWNYSSSEYYRGALSDLQSFINSLVYDAKRLIIPPSE